MSTDQAKSAIDRLVGVVWEIEPSKTPMPSIGPDMANGVALADEAGLPRRSRAKKQLAEVAAQADKSDD